MGAIADGSMAWHRLVQRFYADNADVMQQLLSPENTLKRRQMPLSPENLAEEAMRATEALQGKVVARIARHRATEVLVEFADGTRLFIDRSESGVELSITGGPE